MEFKRYLVGFSYESPPRMNLEFLNQAEELHYAFQSELKDWLCAQGYGQHVEDYGETMALPILFISCTQQVADVLVEHKNVDFVRPAGLTLRG